MTRVLIPLAPGFEELEAVTLIDLLRRASIEVITAGLEAGIIQASHGTGLMPDLPLDQDWTDAKLYQRYGLTPDEIAFIESQVAEHDDAAPDEARPEDPDDE